MKRCSMMLVCLGIAGLAACATESSLETAETSQAVYKGPKVPTPTLYIYKGGALPPGTPTQLWVRTKSPFVQGEELAIAVETSNNTITLAYRILPGDVAKFDTQMGLAGSGYLRPVGGGPPPPPPVHYFTWAVAAASRAIDLPPLAEQDTLDIWGGKPPTY